ncbi:MAG: UDPGP type 1 family protein [Planctomycetota bacterium]|nr:UDPGP type 1 family protein [Planctomycetota bacterium]
MELGRSPRLEDVRAKLRAAGQEHVLKFYAELDAAAQRDLLTQALALPLERLEQLVDRYVRSKESFTLPPDLEPAPYYRRDGKGWDRAGARALGEELLRAGKIAAFTVAGGQGTRLGFDGPKGTFFATALTGKPLFRCLAEWILAASRRYGRAVPWYIMTSPLNHEETVAFFRHHAYFGLAERDVMFFSQGVLPSLDMATGKLLLAEKGVIATNPDGHGGSLRALFASGAIDDMRARGVEHLSYVQIDNPLARVVDPVFIGLHAGAADSSGQMSSKMVEKTDAGEKVGLFCRSGGKTLVVEYSDMPRAQTEARAPSGSLRFNAGSIAIHMISVEFVAELNRGGALSLPLHRAEKKVPHVDLETGRTVQPSAPNAVKLEAFVFDALPLCRGSIVMETERIDEFAPIKNAEGGDSPATCRAIQTERAARWLEAAGVKIPRDDSGRALCTIELSPLTAMDPEDLRRVSLPRALERGAELVL